MMDANVLAKTLAWLTCSPGLPTLLYIDASGLSLARSWRLLIPHHAPPHATPRLDRPALRLPIGLRLVPFPERLQLFEPAQVGILRHVGDLAQPRQVVGLGCRIRRRRPLRRRSGVLAITPLGGEAVLLQGNALQGRLQIAGAEPAPTVERKRDIFGGDREHGARRPGRGDDRLHDIEDGRRVGAVLARGTPREPVRLRDLHGAGIGLRAEHRGAEPIERGRRRRPAMLSVQLRQRRIIQAQGVANERDLAGLIEGVVVGGCDVAAHAVGADAGAVLVAGQDGLVARAAVDIDVAIRVTDVVGLADVDLRLTIELQRGHGVATRQGVLPLSLQAAVVDAVRKPEVLHGGVMGIGPGLAPEQQVLLGVPHTVLGGGKAGGSDRAIGEQHVGMPIAQIAAVLHRRPVNGHVSNHAARGEVAGDERPQHGDMDIQIHLVRQRDDHFPRQPRVLATFDALDRVPERLCVQQLFRGAVGGDNAGPSNADLAAVIEHLAIVAEALRALVGGSVGD